MTLLAGSSVATVRLKKKEDLRLGSGHLWVFSNEIAALQNSDGALLANCYSAGGVFLGSAFYSPRSLISCRLLDRRLPSEELTLQWLKDRMGAAIEFRRRLFPDDSSARWIFGESDGLPGIVVDRYGNTAVVQTFCAAADAMLHPIAEILGAEFGMTTVVERNESILRQHEELERRRTVLLGAQPQLTEVTECGIRFLVDLWGGQKTGYFLDQKMNRILVRSFSRGLRVLDCYSNVGGFSLNAIRGGAAGSTAVDASKEVLELARRSASLNGWADSLETVHSDVFDFLQAAGAERRRFGLVVLDPPSFTRNRKSVPAARKAYIKLNQLGMSVLEPDGLLVTASCSHHITEDTFQEAVMQAARRAGRELQQIAVLVQSPDHPVLPGMPETRYLKGGVYRVI
ncbi:MAG TPA: class I SAM-dependent rRNA methyltransferase [Acidobacteriota bacterium]|jgi:23S rRNA (cytosine1962-C5)-methyltransferase